MASAGRVRPVIALGAARSARAPRRAAARALFGRGGAEKRAGAKGAKSKEELARDSRPSFKVGPALRSGDDSLAWTPNLFTYIGKWIKQPWGKEKTVQELVIYRWATQYDLDVRMMSKFDSSATTKK